MHFKRLLRSIWLFLPFIENISFDFLPKTFSGGKLEIYFHISEKYFLQANEETHIIILITSEDLGWIGCGLI